MAICILILGAESSGNRMLVRVFRESGFIDVTETRHVADVKLPADHSPAVWLRSCPHAREWPDVMHIRELAEAAGYSVHAIVPVRDWYATAHSQVKRGHVRDLDEALIHLRHSTAIYSQLASAGIPFVTLSYESATTDLAGTIERALWLLGIERKIVTTDKTFDGNAKWKETIDEPT